MSTFSPSSSSPPSIVSASATSHAAPQTATLPATPSAMRMRDPQLASGAGGMSIPQNAVSAGLGAFKSSPQNPGGAANAPPGRGPTMYSLPVATTSPRAEIKMMTTAESFRSQQAKPRTPLQSFRYHDKAGSADMTYEGIPSIVSDAGGDDGGSGYHTTTASPSYSKSGGTGAGTVTATTGAETRMSQASGGQASHSPQTSAGGIRVVVPQNTMVNGRPSIAMSGQRGSVSTAVVSAASPSQPRSASRVDAQGNPVHDEPSVVSLVSTTPTVGVSGIVRGTSTGTAVNVVLSGGARTPQKSAPSHVDIGQPTAVGGEPAAMAAASSPYATTTMLPASSPLPTRGTSYSPTTHSQSQYTGCGGGGVSGGIGTVVLGSYYDHTSASPLSASQGKSTWQMLDAQPPQQPQQPSHTTMHAGSVPGASHTRSPLSVSLSQAHSPQSVGGGMVGGETGYSAASASPIAPPVLPVSPGRPPRALVSQGGASQPQLQQQPQPHLAVANVGAHALATFCFDNPSAHSPGGGGVTADDPRPVSGVPGTGATDVGLNPAALRQYVTQMEATGDFAVAPALLQVTGGVAKRIAVEWSGVLEYFQVGYGEDGAALHRAITGAFGMAETAAFTLVDATGCHVAATFVGLAHNHRYRMHVAADPRLTRPASFATTSRRVAPGGHPQRAPPSASGVTLRAVLVGCDYSSHAAHFHLLRTNVLDKGVGGMRRYLDGAYADRQIVELTGARDAAPENGGTGKASILHWLHWLSESPAHVNLFYFAGHSASMNTGAACEAVLLPSDFTMGGDGFCVLEAREVWGALDGLSAVQGARAVCVFDVGYPSQELLRLPSRVRVYPCGADRMIESQTDQDSEVLCSALDVTAITCLGSAATRASGAVAGALTAAVTSALAAQPATVEGLLAGAHAAAHNERVEADLAPAVFSSRPLDFGSATPL